MIEFTRSYKAAGAIYETLEEAQAAELVQLLKPKNTDISSVCTEEYAARVLVENASKVICILTTTKDSRPRARKENGAVKKRKPKVIDASETAA
jgi:hypothetical protein